MSASTPATTATPATLNIEWIGDASHLDPQLNAIVAAVVAETDQDYATGLTFTSPRREVLGRRIESAAERLNDGRKSAYEPAVEDALTACREAAGDADVVWDAAYRLEQWAWEIGAGERAA